MHACPGLGGYRCVLCNCNMRNRLWGFPEASISFMLCSAVGRSILWVLIPCRHAMCVIVQDLADKAKEALQAQHQELQQLHGMLEAREAMLHKLADEHVSTQTQRDTCCEPVLHLRIIMLRMLNSGCSYADDSRAAVCIAAPILLIAVSIGIRLY